MSGPAKGGMPPWINGDLQGSVAARDGDIWISVPAKSGTNWMMNIVHQLLSGGDAAFDNIYSVVPWPEFVERPGQPAQEVLDRLAAMPTGRRRALKTHGAPPQVPFIKSGTGKDVKYVVVCRNPEEALVSFKLFIDQHTDAFFELWQAPKAALTRPDFATFYREIIDPRGMQGMHFGFLASWWPLRHEPNVRLFHFADMKRDLQGSVREVARFLGITPRAAEWAKIDECASFDWMKKNESKFEPHPLVSVPVLTRGGMIRKGKTGASHEDGMTPELAQHLRSVGSRILPDEQALAWLYNGGPIP